jgi:hypothetical protein
MLTTRKVFLFVIIGLSLSGITHAFNPTQNAADEIGDLALFEKVLNLPVGRPGDLIDPMAANWTGALSTGPELHFQAAGPAFPIAGTITDETSAFEVVRGIASARAERWLGSDSWDFMPLNAVESSGKWHVTLLQAYEGVPVYGSKVTAVITARDKLAALTVRLFPSDKINPAFSLSDRTALNLLASDPSVRIDFSRKVFFPVQQGEALVLLPAWQVRGITDRPEYRPAGIVNALTGEILLKYNDVAFDAVQGTVTGLVLPFYWHEEPQEWVQKYQLVNVDGQGYVYTDDQGNYLYGPVDPGEYDVVGQLYGSYVNVNYEDGPDASYEGVAQTSVSHDWLWDYEMARQDEVNVYYHTIVVHDYFKDLQPDFTAMDFPLPATVAYNTNWENAMWNGSGMFFGEGGSTFRNFALFCDVIYHEYTHGVTDMIYPPGMLPYTGQPGAMNEGWSDYFACSITDEPLIGEGGLYLSGQVMRDLDNTLRFPDNWVGEVHADGKIIGGAMWDLREELGAEISDSLLHYAKYYLAETFDDYFFDILVFSDDDGDLSNGGPYHQEIYNTFGMHGIGPGLDPVLQITPSAIVEDGTGGSAGNGDGFYDPGETLAMTFSVRDSRNLYPPAAQDVTVTVSTDDPHLSLYPETFYLGEVAPGESVQAPESLMITVAPDADLAFSDIYFDITANGGTYQTSDDVELIVGHPLTLLVDDDGGTSYQSYLNTSLRWWGQVFSTYKVSLLGELPLDYMDEFDVLIWITGDETYNTLTAEDQSNLSAFLDNGGRLLLSGQNLNEDIGQTNFFADYLGAEAQGDTVDYYQVLDGVDGDIITDSFWVMIFGAGAANNQTSPSAIGAINGAVEILHYHNDPETRAGAVRYETETFKTATFAFGVEAISGLAESTPRGELLCSVLNWFGLETAVVPEGPVSLPAKFAIGKPYPNPFNPTTVISYQLAAASHVNLTVYDVTGREIAQLVNGQVDAGLHQVTFAASGLASGIYLIKIQANTADNRDTFSGVQKVILLK